MIDVKKRNEAAYKMRKIGMQIKEISEKLCVSCATISYGIADHCRENNLERPFMGVVPFLTDKKIASLFTVEEHGPKWHKMHCGKGLRSPDIAHIEGADVETVREILFAYRQKIWG